MTRLLLVPLALAACHEAHTGITKAQAMKVVTNYGYTDVLLGPTPTGWIGTATPINGGYTIRVFVDNRGLLTFAP